MHTFVRLKMAKKDKQDNKTNAMRILETAGIPYEYQSYECDEFIDGAAVADRLGLPHEQVFKTLVTVAPDKQHYVFVIPIDDELDLKKCARSVGAKSVAMIHVKELFPLTGYVRGGCTSIGMKKPFPTFLHISAESADHIFVSAGKVGFQIKISPAGLGKLIRFSFADLVTS